MRYQRFTVFSIVSLLGWNLHSVYFLCHAPVLRAAGPRPRCRVRCSTFNPVPSSTPAPKSVKVIVLSLRSPPCSMFHGALTFLLFFPDRMDSAVAES